MRQPWQIEWNSDAAQIFGCRMTQNIVQCVAMTPELAQFLPGIDNRRIDTPCSPRLQLWNAAIGSGHGAVVQPVAQPSAPIKIRWAVRGERDAWKDKTYVLVET